MKKLSSRRSLRYQDIANTLREHIRSGHYAVDSVLPTEVDLCRSFGVSRHTVREALRQLTVEGLIVRRPRAGSRVVATQTPAVYAQTVTSIDQLLNYPDTRRETVSSSHVRLGSVEAQALQTAPGSRWFRISTLRYPKRRRLPMCWIDIYLPPTYAGIVKHKKHNRLLVCDQVVEMYGESLEKVRMELYAAAVPERIAGYLGVDPGSPGLFVLRHYLNATGVPFEITLSVHPYARYRYAFEVGRS